MNPTESPITSVPRPLVFGEVLFDVFPDGEVLGGAAFNLAWNLKGLGAEPLLVTRVGDDDRGQRILDAMRSWEMSTSGVQTDSRNPTGFVSVDVREGEPTFDIVADVAYDFIDAGAALEAARREATTILYHGSLATRSPVSRNALEQLVTRTRLPRFVDINLRAPWWERERVVALLRGAAWVKLNEDELRTLAATEGEAGDGLEKRAVGFRKRHDVGHLVVTRGGGGAFIVSGDNVTGAPSPPVRDLKDTVGAGDAFAAVTLFGAHHGWSAETMVRRAVDFAARICTLRGATTDRRELYETAVREWNQAAPL